MRSLARQTGFWGAISCVFLLGFIMMTGGCQTAAQFATQKPKQLRYVGNVVFSPPEVTPSAVTVPLEYGGGEWDGNSAFVPYRVKSAVKDNQIEMTLIECVAGGDAGAKPVPGYRLELPPGTHGAYEVFYRDPDGTRHRLGMLQIPKAGEQADAADSR